MSQKSKDYEILCKIGQGSFGTVFKVKRKSDKQILVMKQIKIPTLTKSHQQESLQEVAILSSLSNPYIVKYYESFVENSTLHIIMEYCEKGDLSQILKKNPLSVHKIWKFFIQICIGLEYLHSRQILHRDIKTLNIFLSGDESVRIGDMGVAKIMNNTATFAQTQVGSPYYLSPELCEEKPYNSKSDVWALGCVLYEMCSGRHPFTAANQAALMMKIVKGIYVPLGFEVCEGLREIVDICLEKDLKKRPSVQSLLLRSEVGRKVEELNVNVPVGSVLYKYKKVSESSEEVSKENTEKKCISAMKLVTDVKRQIFETRRLTFQNTPRPMSAVRPEHSRLDTPVKPKPSTPLKFPANLKSDSKPTEVQSANRANKPKQLFSEMFEKIQSSNLQPYFAARNPSPHKPESKPSTPPNLSRLNFQHINREISKIHKKTTKTPKFESFEDIQLVQNLPEFPLTKQKLSVKFLKESSPIRSVFSQSTTKKQFNILVRPLLNPVYKQSLNKEKKNNEDDRTVLKEKESESVRNEESLRKECLKMKSEIVKMIGREKFEEMHEIFTSIIVKERVGVEDQIRIERFVNRNIRGESSKAIYNMYKLLTVETDLAKEEETIRSIRSVL